MTEKAVIELTAIDRASAVMATVKGKADELSKSADQVKAAWSAGVFDSFTKGPALAVVGVLGAASAAAIGLGTYFVGLAKQTMEAQAALKSMSEVTGASVEGLSAIRGVAKLAGTDMEAVAGGMTKLAKNVSTGGDEIEKGLKAIGLSLKDLQGLKTEEQFAKVAQAMSHYADGAGKTAAAQIIMGKSGAQLLPTMKDLAEAGDLVAKTTTAQALQADELEKNIKRLTMAKEAWKKVVGAELVPVLDDVVKVLLKTQTETNGTLDTSKRLAADGSIKEWAQNAALGLAFLYDAARALPVVFQAVGSALAAGAVELVNYGGVVMNIANAIMQAARPAEMVKSWEAARDGMGRMGLAAKEARNDIDKLFAGYTAASKRDALAAQFQESAAAASKLGDAANSSRPQVTGLGGAAAATAEKVNQLGKSLNDLWNKLNNNGDAETAKEMALLFKAFQTGALSAAALANGLALVTKGSKAYKNELDQLIAAEKLKNEFDEAQFQGEEIKRLGIEEGIKSVRELIEQTREETRVLGMSNEERIISTALLKAQKAGIDTTTEAWAKMAAELRKAVYDKSASEATLKNLEETRRQSEQIWQGIGQDITTWIMSGFKNTRDLLKRMFETLILRPIISPIANGLAGGLQGLLGGLLGGSGGAGGGGGLLSGLLGNSGLLGGILGTGAGGIGGGILAGLIGPGSGLGSALGLASAVGPPTALAGAGVAGGAGSLGGSISSLIGAIPGWGWAAMAAAAVAALFIKDEKGFKFDNSLRNVAAAPANVQQAMLGNFAPSGDVDGKLLGAIQPFITKVQALDKYIGTNLLSDQTLADVRERIQQLQNPRWWNLEDKDAIEKASKYFLQQRYGAAFESINEQVATTIKTFQGSADELLAYIDSFITMRETVLAAQRAAQDAISGTSEALQGMLDQQSNSVLAAYRAQQRGVGDLLNIVPDAENALAQLVTGMSSFRSAALQMMLQIKQVQDAVGSMFGDTIRSLQLSIMTPEQQFAFLQQEADSLFAQALASNDPLQIQQLLQRLNADVNQAMSLLSPEQRAALVPEQITRLQDVNSQIQARLADLNTGVQNNLQATLQSLSDKLDKVAQAQLDAAAKQNDAADKMNDAADKMPRDIDINFTANVPGTTTVEVGG